MSWKYSKIELNGNKILNFYCDLMVRVQHLLSQRAYKDFIVYPTMIEHNGMGNRMYGEIHTADLWWETHVSGGFETAPKALEPMLISIIGYTTGRCNSCASNLCF